jgi:hypothetical protein
MLDQTYRKTEAGRAEISQRALPLSRSTRNLLLMLDTTRTARGWLGMVHGTTESDLTLLLEHGLIMSTVVDVVPDALAPAQGLSYDELYAYLTQTIKKQIGLIKGVRLTLEVERCTELPALQALAWRLVAEIDSVHGEEAADRARLEMRL